MASQLAFSLHKNHNDAFIEQQQAAWPDVVAGIFSEMPIVADKNTLPCFIPVQWRDTANGKKKRSVGSVHFLVLDIDQGLTETSLAALLEKLSPHAHVVHPTHRCHKTYHAKGHYKVRGIIPLSEPIPLARWEKFWFKAEAYFGAWTLDSKCKNANHLYYLPAAPSEEAREWMRGGIFSEAHKPPLDVALIEALPSPHPVAKASAINIPLADVEAKLQKLAARMEKKKDPTLGLALSALLRGLPYAEHPGRHEAMLRLTNLIAREFPQGEPEILAAIFERSHEQMEGLYDTPPDDKNAVVGCVRTAQEKYHAEMAEYAKWDRQRTAADNKRAAGVADPDYVYGDEDRAAIANGLGVSVESMKWVLMSPATKEVFMVTKKGIVNFIFTAENFANYIGYLQPTGIDLYNWKGPKNAPRKEPKSLKDLASQKHTKGLKMIQHDNTISQHNLNNDVLTVPCPRAPLTPVYSDTVDGYLRALFCEDYPKAQDWLAWFPDTTRLSCALFLSGPGGIGKTLLACGLARIWEHGEPITFDHAISNFNFDITRTPFIFADEGLTRAPGNAEHLRKFTGNYSFKVEKKYGDTATSLGARRVMIAANNKQALNFQSNLEKDDLDALEERIWICRGRPQGRGYLDALPFKTRKAMADTDIARHVLWLAENRRPAVANGRFVVSGSADVASELVLADGPSQKIFTILQTIMDQSHGLNAKSPNKLHATGWGDGKLHISGPAIKEKWGEHEFREERWTQPGKHLQKVGTITMAPFKGKRIKTCRVNTALFYEFLEQCAGVDSEPYRAMVDGKGGT